MVCQIIKKESADIIDDDAPQMAIRSINDLVFLDCLIPSVLVYGARPQLGLQRDIPAVLTYACPKDLRKGAEKMYKHFEKLQISLPLTARNRF